MTRRSRRVDDVPSPIDEKLEQVYSLFTGNTTGRKCDGYSSFHAIETTELSGPQGKDIDLEITIPGLISSRPFEALQETRSLDYFYQKTLPSLFGFIETDLWMRLVPQLSEQEPAIKAAVSALGSFHELCGKHGFDKVFMGKTGDDIVALKQYTKAINQLRARMSEGRVSRTVALVTCLLFLCLEFMRGDRDAAMMHLKGGMSILRLQPRDQILHDREDIPDDCLALAFSRISLLATLYGQPSNERFAELMSVDEPEKRSEFTDLETARNSLINITNACLGVAYYMDYSLFPGQHDADVARLSVLEGIQQWHEAFQPLLESESVNVRGATLLKCSILLDRIWMARYGGPRNECAFDDHIADFKDIIKGMEMVVANNDPTGLSKIDPILSVDYAMIPTLYFTANKCRDRLLRRRAIELLKLCPRREGFYDSMELARVSEFIVEVEEKALPPLPSTHRPPETTRVQDYTIENRSPQTNSQEVRLYHGLSIQPESLLAKRTFNYGELMSNAQI